MKKYLINLDLHGGDFAPKSVLEGAMIAKINNPHILTKLRQGTEKTSIVSKEDEFKEIFDLYKKLIK